MNDFKFEFTEGEPKPEDFKALSEGLLAHHASKGHKRTWKKFCIFLKDKNRKAHAGITVTFTWNGMHIDSLWVDDSIRGQDWGSRLLKMVEKEAVKRNCTIAYTDTFSWQAPEFYKKHGYTLYGKLGGFPKGESLNYFCKNL